MTGTPYCGQRERLHLVVPAHADISHMSRPSDTAVVPTPTASDPSSIGTRACHRCEVTWDAAEGTTCWSCGRTTDEGALDDPTRPPRTSGHIVASLDRDTILRAHAMGLPDPRSTPRPRSA